MALELILTVIQKVYSRASAGRLEGPAFIVYYEGFSSNILGEIFLFAM